MSWSHQLNINKPNMCENFRPHSWQPKLVQKTHMPIAN